MLRLVTIGRKPLFDGEEGCISILEVAMDGSPSVFVRDLLFEEGNRLKRLSRKAASEAKRERALICWASATKMSAAADRGAGRDRRVACGQGHRGVQRAGVREDGL